MIGQDFRDALRAGTNVYGTLITATSTKNFDVAVSLGLDFVFICTEHITYNPETLSWMCRAYKAAGINPVVRILAPDPYLATQALDAGASAILVPYVEEVEDVYDLVAAVKYRPLKGRKVQRLMRGEEEPTAELRAYLQNHNRNHTLLLNMESPTGVANLEKFLAIPSFDGPGVDGIVIGPHDLSTSYDMPEKYRSPEFLELSCGIIQKARKLGIAAGSHNGSRGSVDIQMEWAKAGANIILHSADNFLFADRLQEDLNKIREVKGDKLIGGTSSAAI